MKIIKCATMPDGTKVQLEDWSGNDSKDNLTIGAYPMARNTSKYGWVRGGETFRLTIASNVYSGYVGSQVSADFDLLVSGAKSLKDLSGHFWNGQKDMWYLGMQVENGDQG